MKFNCDSCKSVCCANQVQLSKSDLKRFREHNIKAKVDVVTNSNNEALITLRKDTELMCQFNINNRCSIYEIRPDVCRDFQCRAKDYNEKAITKMLNKGKYERVANLLLEAKDKREFIPKEYLTTTEDLIGMDIRKVELEELILSGKVVKFEIMHLLGASNREIKKTLNRAKH